MPYHRAIVGAPHLQLGFRHLPLAAQVNFLFHDLLSRRLGETCLRGYHNSRRRWRSGRRLLGGGAEPKGGSPVSKQYDVVVIGGGPGGYVAAIRATQLGKRAAVVERDALGGVCLNWGCIPSKALLKSAEVYSLFRRSSEFGLSTQGLAFDFPAIIRRSRNVASRLNKGVEYLMKKNRIDVVQGTGRLNGRTVQVVDAEGKAADELLASDVILATGARPRSLPGLTIDRQRLMTSYEALALDTPPGSLIIMGGGPIGVEFAYFYSSFGTQVTVVEMLDYLLPQSDVEVAVVLEKSLARAGVTILTSTRVESAQASSSGVEVQLSTPGGPQTLQAELALVAVGVMPNVENLGLAEAGVRLDAKGFIATDEHCRTSVPHIYAIGDVSGPPLLAHAASAEGMAVAEVIAGQDSRVNYDTIASCAYCQPQVASIGLTERQAREQGHEVKVGRFPLRASGKALASGDSEGLVKIVADAKYGEILGAHIVGPDATELIAELGLAMTNELAVPDLARTVHSHPTLAEAIKEAAEDALGRAIHI
ncbi:MAG: dihydrolipoyl dehydrogenase [Deinococcus sp.]|nr:dihydrolipoyl dehydrogenase [Deinococcus sp.]